MNAVADAVEFIFSTLYVVYKPKHVSSTPFRVIKVRFSSPFSFCGFTPDRWERDNGDFDDL